MKSTGCLCDPPMRADQIRTNPYCTARHAGDRVKRYKRWITIGCNDPFLRTLRKCRSLGMAIISGGKPGMCAWHGLCVEATPQQIRQLELWFRAAKISWFKRMPRGAWPVSDNGQPIPWKEAFANCRSSRNA